MNDFQKKVQDFLDKSGVNNPIENRMLDLFDEVGEIAKEINKMSAYGTKKPIFREEVALELGDAFYSLITVANYYNIDLNKSLDLAINKYEKRVQNGGHPGSEND